MRLPYLALIALLPCVAHADAPWGKVDPQTAKPLHDKACLSCHTRMYGGDGSKIMHATLQFPDGSILMGADCPP